MSNHKRKEDEGKVAKHLWWNSEKKQPLGPLLIALISISFVLFMLFIIILLYYYWFGRHSQ